MTIYTTPPGDILTHSEQPAPSEATTQANAIIKAFAACGVSLSLVQSVTAPQLNAYHFNLQNLKDYPKIKRYLPTVGAALHRPILQAPSTVAAVCLTIARQVRQVVSLESVVNSPEFIQNKSTLPAAVGVSSDNQIIVLDFAKMPHILLAGTTGSGKSVALNSIICSILFKLTPNEVRLLLIDLKQTELTPFEGLPHLLHPVATDYKTAIHIIKELFEFMQRRFIYFKKINVKDISETDLPHTILIIDELAELMQSDDGKEVETYLNRLAALGRAAGVHLLLATQRPTRAVIPGLLSANMPCKIALQVSSIRESVVILDHKGAETLTGCGDALIKPPDRVTEIRTQTAYTTAADVQTVVQWWKEKGITKD